MAQSLSKLYVHLIFSTKHREPLLAPSVRGPMHAYLAAVMKDQDCPALKIGGARDHVHLLFRLSKNLPLAEVVEKVKSSSSKWVKTQGRSLQSFHWQTVTAASRWAPPRWVPSQPISRARRSITES